jgi:hypothetical protein
MGSLYTRKQWQIQSRLCVQHSIMYVVPSYRSDGVKPVLRDIKFSSTHDVISRPCIICRWSLLYRNTVYRPASRLYSLYIHFKGIVAHGSTEAAPLIFWNLTNKFAPSSLEQAYHKWPETACKPFWKGSKNTSDKMQNGGF